MPQFNNMLDGFVDAMFILDANVRDQFTGRIVVRKNHRDSGISQFGGHALVNRRGNNRNPANVALSEFSHDRLGPLGIVLSVAKQDVETATPSRGLITADNLREVGIGDLGDDKSKYVAASGRQPPGMHVFEVIEFANNSQHPSAGFLRDIFGVVEHARNRCQRYSGSLGYFAHGVGHKK